MVGYIQWQNIARPLLRMVVWFKGYTDIYSLHLLWLLLCSLMVQLFLFPLLCLTYSDIYSLYCWNLLHNFRWSLHICLKFTIINETIPRIFLPLSLNLEIISWNISKFLFHSILQIHGFPFIWSCDVINLIPTIECNSGMSIFRLDWKTTWRFPLKCALEIGAVERISVGSAWIVTSLPISDRLLFHTYSICRLLLFSYVLISTIYCASYIYKCRKDVYINRRKKLSMLFKLYFTPQ